MYYRLTDDTALRSWTDIGFACIRKGSRRAYPLTERQAAAFLQCDGLHDIDADATVMLSVLRKLVEPCEKGRLPSEWSSYRKYENPCFPMMNIMLTGKCNFNCLHCFNAADNTALMTEWSFDDVCSLFDEARDCGVMGFTITGGEPMMHDRFLDIIREIYKRDMTVFAVNTNGWFITKEILDELKAIGCTPVFKISFDGIGTHDWMRRREGAERYALDSMRLCLENGFRVLSNTQVNRRNLHTIMPTVKLLDSIGVQEMRIIRTSEAPRWLDNASDACLSILLVYAGVRRRIRTQWHGDGSGDMAVYRFASQRALLLSETGQVRCRGIPGERKLLQLYAFHDRDNLRWRDPAVQPDVRLFSQTRDEFRQRATYAACGTVEQQRIPADLEYDCRRP